MLEATLNGLILVDHKIDLNDYTTSSLTLDVISCDDELNDSPWHLYTASAVGEDAVSFKEIYGNKLKIDIDLNLLKSRSFFVLGNENGDNLWIYILPKIIKNCSKDLEIKNIFNIFPLLEGNINKKIKKNVKKFGFLKYF